MKVYKVVLGLLAIYSIVFVVCCIGSPIASHFGWYEIANKMHLFLLPACHHKPEKCFWLLGYPMYLCCRCFGFYLAFMIYGFIYLFKEIKLSKLILFIIFLGFSIDLSINYFAKITTWNITRFISGICLAILVVHFIKYLFSKERGSYEKSY